MATKKETPGNIKNPSIAETQESLASKDLDYKQFKASLDDLSSNTDLLQKIMLLLDVDTPSKLAAELGVTPQTIAKAKKAKTGIPDRWSLYAATKARVPYRCLLTQSIEDIQKLKSDKHIEIPELTKLELSAKKGKRESGFSEFVETRSYRSMMLNSSIVENTTITDVLKPNVFMYRINNNSMEPTIKRNDYVFVKKYDEESSITNNGIYLLWIKENNTQLVCRLSISGSGYKISYDNKDLESLEFSKESIAIYGRIFSCISSL